VNIGAIKTRYEAGRAVKIQAGNDFVAGEFICRGSERNPRINAAARNPVLASTYRTVNARLQALRFRSNFDERKWRRAVQEHEQMIELLAARDGTGLRSLLVMHLRHKCDAVLELMQRGDAPAGSLGPPATTPALA
jgi:DNA-binding GntR family transcriptional regulator